MCSLLFWIMWFGAGICVTIIGLNLLPDPDEKADAGRGFNYAEWLICWLATILLIAFIFFISSILWPITLLIIILYPVYQRQQETKEE